MDKLFLLFTLLGLSPAKRVEGYLLFREREDEGLRLEALLRGLFSLTENPLALTGALVGILSAESKQHQMFGIEVSLWPSTELVETAIVNVLCTEMQEHPWLRSHAQVAYYGAFEAAWQRMLVATQPGDLRVPGRNALLQRLNSLVLQGQERKLFVPADLRARLATLLIDGRFGLVQDLVRVFYWTGIFSRTEAGMGTIYINREVLPNRGNYDAMREVCTDAVLVARGGMQPGRHWALAAMHMTDGEESASCFNQRSIETLRGDLIALDLRHLFEVMSDEQSCESDKCQRYAQALTQWCVLGGSENVVRRLSEQTPQPPRLVLTEKGIAVTSTTSDQGILLRLLGRGEWASTYLLLQEFGWTGVFTRTLLNGVRGGGYGKFPRHAESARVEAALTALLAPAFVREYAGATLRPQYWGGVAAIGQQVMLRIDEVRAHLLNEIKLRDAKDMKALEAAIEASTVIRLGGFQVGGMGEYITDDGEFGPPSPDLLAQKQAFERRQEDELEEILTRLRNMARVALTEAVTCCQPVRLNVFE